MLSNSITEVSAFTTFSVSKYSKTFWIKNEKKAVISCVSFYFRKHLLTTNNMNIIPAHVKMT